MPRIGEITRQEKTLKGQRIERSYEHLGRSGGHLVWWRWRRSQSMSNGKHNNKEDPQGCIEWIKNFKIKTNRSKNEERWRTDKERPKNDIEIDCSRDSVHFSFFFSSFFFFSLPSSQLWTSWPWNLFPSAPSRLFIANEGWRLHSNSPGRAACFLKK